ncbi:MAG: MBOAT family O-acyltransferase [Lachnospiraceae bacterium]|nr:MBOAT family O-acyltransferase [Lachnospiraceae bacterium]
MFVKTLTDMGITLSYHTIGFILFFAAFILIYFVMQASLIRRGLILAANLFFYYYMSGIGALVILIGTSLIVYFGSFMIGIIYINFERNTAEMTRKEKKAELKGYKGRARIFLILSIVLVLAILLYVKIGGLMHFTRVTSVLDLRPGKLLVPLGLSYYTFSCIGYLLDIYWRKTRFDLNYFDLLTGMSYFPIIVQGPIANYGKLFKQFKKLPKFNFERVCFGLQRMIWGFFKKLVIADRLTMYSTTIFGSVGDYAGIEIIIAAVFNALAIYADFSGCMEIVIGASEVLGITLEENFRQPFFARTAAEFWRRWHITLGTWFKDYVYTPIAMSRFFMRRAMKAKERYGAFAAQLAQGVIPLMVVWLLTGLWHGTGMDYIVWGLYWGVLIVLGMVFEPVSAALASFFHTDREAPGYQFLQMARTFVIFCIGRMLTATGTLAGFGLAVERIFAEIRIWVLFDGSLFTHGLDQKDWYVAMFGILVMLIVDILHERSVQLRRTIASQPLLFRWLLYILPILFILVYGIYGAGYDATSFAYGGF